ncbi:general odorant-binding protein 56h-like [Eurosta solidaginis]|uniref:general odorant-binding protein 56h-like n=1 Tax=Eurosta solidaginis TaxID=178769 RepID=UPI00353175F4
MTSFITIVLVFVFAVFGMCSTSGTETRKHIEDCAKENHVSPKELQDLEQGTLPSEPSENLKCSQLCVMVKEGWMDESGTFKADEAKAKMPHDKNFTAAVDGCKSQVGSSPCDTAMKITRCMINHKSL